MFLIDDGKKLYEYYKQYNSIDEIPTDERAKLEKQIFRKPLEEIWQGCIDFFEQNVGRFVT